MFTGKSGLAADADATQEPVKMDTYYIVSDKCTECVGFHDEPQCAAVCPVDCCVDDPNFHVRDGGDAHVYGHEHQFRPYLYEYSNLLHIDLYHP